MIDWDTLINEYEEIHQRLRTSSRLMKLTKTRPDYLRAKHNYEKALSDLQKFARTLYNTILLEVKHARAR